MRLTIRRLYQHPTCVQGVLDIDGTSECFTLEDRIRQIPDTPVEQWKVKGETAIPVGEYRVVIDWSVRFNRLMPHILAVPGFTGIRIHSGNTDKNTEGCVLVGETRVNDTTLEHSHTAMDRLFTKLESAIASGDTITIDIINPQETAEEHLWGLPT